MRESHRILQESTGNRWNMEAVFRPEIFGFFQWIPTNFLCFPVGTGRKSLEKIRKISDRNTASRKSPEFRAGLFDLGQKGKISKIKISKTKIIQM
jgi:hypothetical protein